MWESQPVLRPEFRAETRRQVIKAGGTLLTLLAMGLMVLWANDFHAVFWVAVIPAVLSVALLAFGLPLLLSGLEHLALPAGVIATVGALATSRLAAALSSRACSSVMSKGLVR